MLKLVNPKLKVVNDGCPGETTDTFIKGSGVGPAYCAGGPTGSPFPKAFLHHAFPGTQLEDALAVAKEAGTGTITLDIGANDILQFLSHTCGFPVTFSCSEAEVEAEIGHVVTNVGVILAQLRAAAPRAKIVFVSQYNPYPTLLSPEGRGDATVEALNGAIKSVAAGFNVKFANTLRVINFSGTHGGPEVGRHPDRLRLHRDVPGRHVQPGQPGSGHPPDQSGLRRDGRGADRRLPGSLSLGPESPTPASRPGARRRQVRGARALCRAAAGSPLPRTADAEGADAGPHLGEEDLRHLERGEVAAPVDPLVVAEVGRSGCGRGARRGG